MACSLLISMTLICLEPLSLQVQDCIYSSCPRTDISANCGNTKTSLECAFERFTAQYDDDVLHLFLGSYYIISAHSGDAHLKMAEVSPE